MRGGEKEETKSNSTRGSDERESRKGRELWFRTWIIMGTILTIGPPPDEGWAAWAGPGTYNIVKAQLPQLKFFGEVHGGIFNHA